MKKIFLFLLLILFGIVGVSAVTDEDLRTGGIIYYTFDDDFISGTTIIDSIGNYNGTNVGATCSVEGLINQSCDFSGGNYMTIPNSLINTDMQGVNAFSLSFWLKRNTINDYTPFYIRTNANSAGLQVQINQNDKLRLGGRSQTSDSFQEVIGSTSLTSTSSWYHIVAIFDYENSRLISYINGELESNSSVSFGSSTLNFISNYIEIGRNAQVSGFLNGKIDEIYIRNNAMTSAEVLELYNRQLNNLDGSQYDFTSIGNLQFNNISVNNQELINNTFFNTTELNFSTEVLNTSTNANVNQTYFLYNSSGLIQSNQFATNNVNGSFQLNLNEGEYNIYFYAQNNQTNVTSQNYTFTIDLTPPTINNSIPNEINSYFFEANQFSCSDTNLAVCNITINNQILNTTQNTTLTLNGNLSYTIFAEDLAGNTVTENGNLFVNPFQYIRFFDNPRNLFVEDFNFGNYSSNNTYVKIPLYDFGIGTHSLEFEKFGYNKEFFNFNFTNSSELNITYNVTPVTMTIQVYDENSPGTQLNFNATITDGNNFIQFLDQTNLELYYNETIPGEISLTIESSGFRPRKIFTNLTPFSTISHRVYLLNESIAQPIIFQTQNIAQSQAISDVVLTFRKIINGSITFIGQAKTDSQGFTFFNMDPLGDYEITISKGGYVTQIINSIPAKFDYRILMQETDRMSSFLFQDFSFMITPKTRIDKLPFNASVVVFDEANLISSMKFTVSGNNFNFSETTIDSNGGTITFEIENESPRYILNLTVMREGERYEFIEIVNYYELINSTTSLRNIAKELEGEENNASRVFIMLILYVVAIVLGSIFGATIGAMFGLLPITIFATPAVGWISPGVAALLYLVTILGVLYFDK